MFFIWNSFKCRFGRNAIVKKEAMPILFQNPLNVLDHLFRFFFTTDDILQYIYNNAHTKTARLSEQKLAN